MRKLDQLLLMVGIAFLLFQCQSDDSLPAGTIIVALKGETMEIINRCGEPISYFAVESETAALIDWAASSHEDNTIDDGDIKTIPWSDIAGAPVQDGDSIIIYWWPAQSEVVDFGAINQRVMVL